MEKILLFVLLAVLVLTSCCNMKKCNNKDCCKADSTGWQDVLKQKMPYLGHRNWIVITDMAYPLQSGEGIITLYANEPYEKVLATVKGEIDKAPHVFAHVYRDKELSLLTDKEIPGVEKLRGQMDSICGKDVAFVPHEDLIKRLDEASKIFSVIIIKTPLTMAYTTTFFELGCKYWDADKQAKLDEEMKK
jgi:D-ribose pyranose/furanose isomerase RbsD